MEDGPGSEAQRIDFYLDAKGLIIPSQSSGKNNQEWSVLNSIGCKAAILFGEKLFFLSFHYNQNMGRCRHMDTLPPSLI